MTVLKGARVRLRPTSPDDADARYVLGNNANIVRMYGGSLADTKPMTKDDAANWAQGQAKNPHAWVIEVDGSLIGEIKLHSISARDQRASMAIAIYDPTRLGMGIGTEAIHLLLEHAFSELKLHRIGIRVLTYNERAIRAYAKCGFIVEGQERETAFVDGKWHDDLMMGLLSTEYKRLSL